MATHDDDTEYLYPPRKWQGAPCVTHNVTSWPAEVDARLTSLEAVQNLDGERLKRVEVMAEQLLALFMEHRLEYERNREDERK